MRLLDDVRDGKLSPERFACVRAGFFPEAPRRYAEELKAAGAIQRAVLLDRRELGDDRVYLYDLVCANRTLALWIGLAPDDRVSTLSLRRK
jgi:hypothetical protein